MQKQTLTVNEAAEYSGIGRNTLRTLIARSKIPAIRIGNKTIIRTKTLDLYTHVTNDKAKTEMNKLEDLYVAII